ncbi:MAG TPA: hypothetical protein VFJ96_07350 [Gemmatimonadaceae bacterium]|nr:hypothetical protein [Gemmatimonadaceae bacterium]
MGIDVRLPIGAMFTLLGILLGVYGIVAPDQRSGGANGVNINLWWGLCLLVFGVACLTLAIRAHVKLTKSTPRPSGSDDAHGREYDAAYRSPSPQQDARSDSV